MNIETEQRQQEEYDPARQVVFDVSPYPFVGRDVEIQTIKDGLSRAHDKRTNNWGYSNTVISILGEMGYGKTAVMQQIYDLLAEDLRFETIGYVCDPELPDDQFTKHILQLVEQLKEYDQNAPTTKVLMVDNLEKLDRDKRDKFEREVLSKIEYKQIVLICSGVEHLSSFELRRNANEILLSSKPLDDLSALPKEWQQYGTGFMRDLSNYPLAHVSFARAVDLGDPDSFIDVALEEIKKRTNWSGDMIEDLWDKVQKLSICDNLYLEIIPYILSSDISNGQAMKLLQQVYKAGLIKFDKQSHSHVIPAPLRRLISTDFSMKNPTEFCDEHNALVILKELELDSNPYGRISNICQWLKSKSIIDQPNLVSGFADILERYFASDNSDNMDVVLFQLDQLNQLRPNIQSLQEDMYHYQNVMDLLDQKITYFMNRNINSDPNATKSET
jgi:hypothetical protein